MITIIEHMMRMTRIIIFTSFYLNQIPITKLEKHGLFKKSLQTDLTPVEKELKALSEFFSSSCLVGKYSPDLEVDAALSNRIYKFI